MPRDPSGVGVKLHLAMPLKFWRYSTDIDGEYLRAPHPARPCGAGRSMTDAAASAPSADRVLVIDDERVIREMLRRMLLMAGFDVVLAAGGAEGLRVLGTDPHVALILLDLDMPGIDGRRFRDVQRSDPRLASVPTIIVSGAVFTDELREQLQVAHFVQKPVRQATLVRLVESYCRRIGDARFPVVDSASLPSTGH
jgi:CheY-like chemotaxis protein